ncbi:MAG: SUF system NifU family Fe-S cluster assembly protein [Bacilli bacterium]|nr:SUF system NifU family Fe-S cluster assembly protein [Bacilli bacterium]
MDSNVRREIILENYQDPMNRGLIDDDTYLKVNTNSESCIDNLDFQIKIEDNTIKDIRFDGEACAISTSATSIMIQRLIGKTVEEVKNILKNYQNMIEDKEYDKDVLGELIVYEEINKQPNRIHCALIPSIAVQEILSKIEGNKVEYGENN